MIYILDDESGEESLHVRGELHKYLFKVRRHEIGDEIAFRSRKNLKILTTYKVEELDARYAVLRVVSSAELEVKSKKSLHIGWCIIDPKSIEKALPSLCEIGVERISFVYCERSQKSFKLDFKRFERLQEASMQQCGRSSYIELDMFKNLKEFLEKYPDTKIFDFCQNSIENFSDIKTILVGCEGGFSKKEREFFAPFETFKLDTSMVLRSESAVLALASKIVL